MCACDGRVDVHDYYDEFGEHQQDVSEVFTPKFFDPPLSLLDIPEDCPEAVAGHLQTSFSLYFNNPSASANSARIALEHLMGSLGVPKISQNDSLHSRIGRLAPPYDEVKELLLAAKWLGNDGSHGGDLTKAEVNILYDVLELALHETFDKTKETIRAKARAINAARKKP